MHHYKHNIGDYRRRTGHLSLTEHGIYRQLMDEYYLNELPIPDKTKEVYRRLQARTEEEQSAVRNVLTEFFERRDGAWHHAHCDEVIAHYQGNAEASRANGKLGGRPRKEPGNNQPGSKNKPTRKATNNHKPRTNTTPQPPKGEIDVLFENFWALTLRKVGKPKAQAAFAKALTRIGGDAVLAAEAISAGALRHKAFWSALIDAGDETKVPHPTTWLNRDGWGDQVPGEGKAKVKAEKAWHETRDGIEAKAKELDHPPYNETESFPLWAASVKRMAGLIEAPPVGLEELTGLAERKK